MLVPADYEPDQVKERHQHLRYLTTNKFTYFLRGAVRCASHQGSDLVLQQFI
jgi:hypothetical protein